jgi:AcrR family transcriptional regulator
MAGATPSLLAGASANTAVSPSRREANKFEKLQRIKAAASELFVSKGFDDTTVREIAARAGVGLGTLFSYSLNKRDLLFLLGNDRLEAVAARAAAAVDPAGDLLSNLMAIFGAHFDYFGSDAVLGRLVLREMTFYESGAQAERFRRIRARVMDAVVGAIRMSQLRGDIAARRDERLDADVFFAIYQVELRRWLASPAPEIEAGRARLARALIVCIEGFQPLSGKRSR